MTSAAGRKAATSVVTPILTKSCCKLVPEKKAGSKEKADSWVFVQKHNCLFPCKFCQPMPERHLLYYSTVHPCAAKGTAIIVKKETHTVHIFPSVTHFQLRLQSAEEVVDTGIPLSALRCWPKTQAQSSHAPSKREFVVTPKTTE